MTLDQDHVERPLRKLRKLLKQFPSDAPPEQVHILRTHTRRLEAVIAALTLESSPQPRRLLKLIKPLRKAAGQVRDMDVLIGDVLTLKNGHPNSGPNPDPDAGLIQLVEYLATTRIRRARRLHKAVAARRNKARRRLKQCSQLVEAKVREQSEPGSSGSVGPEILMTELRHWPPLDDANLHEFRIRIKELGYMLQLSGDSDRKWIDRLDEVKDTIGDWHDWLELARIAHKVLHGDANPVLRRIEDVQRTKFHDALTSANALRREITLSAGPPRDKSRPLPRKATALRPPAASRIPSRSAPKNGTAGISARRLAEPAELPSINSAG